MEEKGFDHMNVIPLVDVMLVLLTIVLTTSSFVVSGAIPVALPEASVAREEARQSQVVTIDSRGVVYFNTTPVSLEGLRERLVQADRAGPIEVRADKDVTVQACVEVLDLLSSEGFRRVSLLTDRRRK